MSAAAQRIRAVAMPLRGRRAARRRAAGHTEAPGGGEA
ncbi:MAG: hypothetical protein AVDCRST_MAG38-2674 [uncultured Solirubrobacteraceae bacterium]|uniref:Uncharacterized protein n=1 Tax=uncultured Solirubrobacteraceae bacterium TaxID=1162706 RepID=A0A6J4SHU3_9ACTN|nr:MAG: hypothetical protein AVDCRST_MAG38-2674 [uncultured Solirubrobacteraceae bacterium]